MTQTIFAMATAPGRAAVAVIRVSGPDSAHALRALGVPLPAARRAVLRRLRDGDGAVLDEALVLWMPGPASYTGEDTLELHLHGGLGVMEAVSARLVEAGLVPAEPGAFTRRAYEAGKLDLIQAEAVADLIDAETEAQRRQALDQLGGAASRLHESWRRSLIEVLARLEATVDFPDDDIPEGVMAETLARLEMLSGELEGAAAERRGDRVRLGFRVALLGAPNAGKSSLFNALLGRDAAIVHASPGTTRDVIEAEMVLGGRKVVLADLAGLRNGEDAVEQEGVRRARAWGAEADLRLHVDGTGTKMQAPTSSADLHVHTKADLHGRRDGLAVSAWTGEGIQELKAEVTARVVAATTGASAPPVTRERHRQALLSAAASLRGAMRRQANPELMAEEVRLAARSLRRLTGGIDTEAILDSVFSTFCIGK